MAKEKPEAFGLNESPRPPASLLQDQIDQNIENVAALQRRESELTSNSQRRVERLGRFIGSPAYLLGLLGIAASWIGANSLIASFGYTPVDPLPFEMLQGTLTLIALITTTIVLIAQNRQSRLEQQHTHLGLQVNLLTEQKVTKLILLIEELRRDLPMVKDRLDPQSAVLQEGADTKQVLSAIEESLTQDMEVAPKDAAPPSDP